MDSIIVTNSVQWILVQIFCPFPCFSNSWNYGSELALCCFCHQRASTCSFALCRSHVWPAWFCWGNASVSAACFIHADLPFALFSLSALALRGVFFISMMWGQQKKRECSRIYAAEYNKPTKTIIYIDQKSKISIKKWFNKLKRSIINKTTGIYNLWNHH